MRSEPIDEGIVWSYRLQPCRLIATYLRRVWQYPASSCNRCCEIHLPILTFLEFLRVLRPGLSASPFSASALVCYRFRWALSSQAIVAFCLVSLALRRAGRGQQRDHPRRHCRFTAFNALTSSHRHQGCKCRTGTRHHVVLAFEPRSFRRPLADVILNPACLSGGPCHLPVAFTGAGCLYLRNGRSAASLGIPSGASMRC